MVKPRDPLTAAAERVDRARCDYSMAKRTGAQKRRVRGVPSQGAGPDYHYRSESDWLWMGELAWDIYRNNMICGSIVDRAIENQIQDGFTYNPQTGDAGLDRELVDWWTEISQDPAECDPANELAFADQTEIVLRSTIVGGDIFGVPMSVDDPRDHGTVELKEFHLCRSPSSGKDKANIFHGVEKHPLTRRRINYHFLPEPIDPNRSVLKKSLAPLSAYYFDEATGREERNVFHVRFPKRSHQTRGLTALAPIFDVAGYHDDVQFLTMVRSRAASLFVFVEERVKDFDPAYLAAEMRMGVDVTRDKQAEYEANSRQYVDVGPGSVLRGLPGAKINPHSPNIPNPEFFPHSKLLLTFLGVNLGMPLVLVLMDASETNFSGFRGALEQARMGFRKNQRRLATRWHRPFLRFKILKRGEQDRRFGRWIERSVRPGAKVDVFRHGWNPPSWPYINPTEDATCDLIRGANMQTSPRRLARERGMEWGDVARETVEDRASAFELALVRAAELVARHNLPQTPEYLDGLANRLAPLPLPERVQLSLSSQFSQPGAAKPAKEPSDA